jgi:serine acetyltransferase
LPARPIPVCFPTPAREIHNIGGDIKALMWSELAADARLYSALRWPGRAGALWHGLIWLRSAGLLLLAMHRVNRRYLVRRVQYPGSAQSVFLGLVVALGRRPLAMLTKSEIGDLVEAAQGVYLSDRGFLILGPERIGSGTLVHERVTIGMRAGEARRPVIGDKVWIGPDCVIYGNLSVGDGATVLPGSVVTINVPPGAVAAGNPATIVRREFDNTALRRSLATDIDRHSLGVQ